MFAHGYYGKIQLRDGNFTSNTTETIFTPVVNSLLLLVHQH
jgi:hypothetical protein